MASAIENKVLEIADEVADKLKFSVVDAEYKKEGSTKVLRIFIDKDGGIGINECETFSREFEQYFDTLDVIKEAYTLEISSPGVDRTLKKEREFLHYIGRKVSVKLYKAMDSLKEFDGILVGFKDKTASISYNEKILEIPVVEAVYIKLYF